MTSTDSTPGPRWKRLATQGAIVVLTAAAAGGFTAWNLTVKRPGTAGPPLSQSTPANLPLPSTTDRPRNLIVVVADGLGFAHLSAGRVVHGGLDGAAAWDRFSHYGWHHPRPQQGFLVDSAASATALATGRRTRNGSIAVDAEGRPLENLFEKGWANGYRTGVVTDSYVWDATPAAFVAHQSNRDQAADILDQLAVVPLEVLFGELEDVGEDQVPPWRDTIELLSQRYHLLDEDLSIPPDLAAHAPLAAIFPEDHVTDLDSTPNLPDMVSVALDRLSAANHPFLLLVETEEADSASHDNDLDRMLAGLAVLDQTLTRVLDFSQADGETLVVFTSDHETGGLALSVTDRNNNRLHITWAGTDHTGTAVPLMAVGPGAESFNRPLTGDEIGRRLAGLLSPNQR